LRIGLMTSAWENGWPVDPEVVAAVEAVARLCSDLGHHVEPVQLVIDADPFTVATARIWSSTLALWTQVITAATGRKVDDTTFEPAMLACHQYGSALTAAELQEAFIIFNSVSRSVGQLFETCDLLLTPTTAVPAPLLGELSGDRHDLDAIGWTAHLFGPAPFTATFNVSGNPAVSLPLGQTKSGLPIGTQFIARHNGEELLLAFAASLERAAPWQRCAPMA
jgi:amidase